MASTKISALPAASALTGSEIVPGVQSGANVGATTLQIVTAATGSSAMTGGTVTASTPLLNHAQTWNASAVTFTGWKLNVTDTASASGSLLADLQAGSSSKFSVRKDGSALFYGSVTYALGTGLSPDVLTLATTAGTSLLGVSKFGYLVLPAASMYGISPNTAVTVTPDIAWGRSAAGVAEFNNGTLGTLRDIKVRGQQYGAPFTVGTLPSASASDGMAYRVTDLNAPALSATAAGGGTTKGVVRSNATNWIVVEIA